VLGISPTEKGKGKILEFEEKGARLKKKKPQERKKRRLSCTRRGQICPLISRGKRRKILGKVSVVKKAKRCKRSDVRKRKQSPLQKLRSAHECRERNLQPAIRSKDSEGKTGSKIGATTF